MTDLNINDSLTYSTPSRLEDGDVNFVSYKASGAQTFGPSETFTIKLSSNNEFLALDRSYLKFKLNTTAISTLHPNGASACISSVLDMVSGVQLPVYSGWDIVRGVKLNSDSSERKSITSVCEQYTGGATGSVTSVNGSFDICLPVPTSIESTEKLVPLAFLNAGHSISYTLNPANKVVVAGSYSITDVEIVACLITPPNSYLEEISKGLAGGGALKMPLQLYKSFTTNCSASLQQTFNIMSGYIGSLNSVTLVEKSNPFVTQNGLSSFFITVDSKRFPRNKSIVTRPEKIYQTLAGYNTRIGSVGVADVNQQFSQLTFKTNGDFSAGIPTANGTLTVDTIFSTVPTTLEVILGYDAMLLVSQNTCSIITDV